ncbi:MAG: type II toxin-antitoxin system VapC family toxin [Gammaproteobacteria bacterium]
MARAQEPGLVFLDTHVVCWLYEGRSELLSATAARAVESGDLFVSPVVDLELQFLHEIGRITKGAGPVLTTLSQELGLRMGEESFVRIVAKAREFTWTRDPFDRLMVAHAALVRARLVSKDQTIRKYFPGAVW